MIDCIEWTGHRNEKGYGRVYVQELGRHVYAHRRSWELLIGPVPTGLCVLHKCDNPPCVNPEHLFLGTKKDNIHDAMAKGRASMPPSARGRYEWFPRGDGHHNSKLTSAIVLDIRESVARGESVTDVARRLGIPSSTARAAACGRSWAHVGGPLLASGGGK